MINKVSIICAMLLLTTTSHLYGEKNQKKNTSAATKNAAKETETPKRPQTKKEESKSPSVQSLIGDGANSKLPTDITAEQLSINATTKQFEYAGNVVIVHGDFTLKANKVTGEYTETNEIKNLVATTAVEITKPDGTRARSDKAVYDNKQQLVIMTEGPVIEQNGSELSADEVRVHLDSTQSEALGQVRVRIIQSEVKAQTKKQ